MKNPNVDRIRSDRESAENELRVAKKNLEFAQTDLARVINRCAKLGHPNAIHDNIEKMSECPDCGHYWGSGRAHY